MLKLFAALLPMLKHSSHTTLMIQQNYFLIYI